MLRRIDKITDSEVFLTIEVKNRVLDLLHVDLHAGEGWWQDIAFVANQKI